jgi:phosphate-transporting ATPase
MKKETSPPANSAPKAREHGPRLAVSNLHVLNLSPVTLALDAGEIAVLEGPSGSGKSLLLRAIGDLDPAAGMVSLDGEDRNAVSGPDWRRNVRYFAAEPGWWRDRVGDHFAQSHETARLLEAFGLPGDAMDWMVERASTGEKQRLALVRGLIDHPAVLLLDEPTSALDDTTAKAVENQLLARICDGGAAAIIVTHDAAQAGRLARRRLVIRDGAVTEVAE